MFMEDFVQWPHYFLSTLWKKKSQLDFGLYERLNKESYEFKVEFVKLYFSKLIK